MAGRPENSSEPRHKALRPRFGARGGCRKVRDLARTKIEQCCCSDKNQPLAPPSAAPAHTNNGNAEPPAQGQGFRGVHLVKRLSQRLPEMQLPAILIRFVALVSVEPIRRPGTFKKNTRASPISGRVLKRGKNVFANPRKAMFRINVQEEQFSFTADHTNASQNAANLPNQELRLT